MHDLELTVVSGPDGLRFVPTRLFPNEPVDQVPTAADLGLGPTELLLSEIGELGGRAIHQIALLAQGTTDDWTWAFPRDDKATWLSTAELFVSVGNASAMLIAAVRETSGLLIQAGGTDVSAAERDPALHRATFLLEASEQYTVSIGHQLTSAAFRMCAANPSAAAALDTKSFRRFLTALAAGASDPAAWTFHKSAVAAAVLVRDQRSGAARCMMAVADLHEARRWQAMERYRHDWFHRVRPDFILSSADSHMAIVRRQAVLVGALRAAARPLRSFALGIDAASPRMAHNRSMRLFAQSTSRQQLVDGTIVAEQGQLERIRSCIPTWSANGS